MVSIGSVRLSSARFLVGLILFGSRCLCLCLFRFAGRGLVWFSSGLAFLPSHVLTHLQFRDQRLDCFDELT